MLCPTCKDTKLVMSERKGVEIDYCPQCRGVWLDRGEIDKIIERSIAEQEKNDRPVDNRPMPPREHYGDKYHHPKYYKKSIWHEIFD